MLPAANDVCCARDVTACRKRCCATRKLVDTEVYHTALPYIISRERYIIYNPPPAAEFEQEREEIDS